MTGPTWDGLLTLAGGVLAFLVILIQVHFSNKGIRTQLQDEKGVRARERHRRNRAFATALLFEIDNFYKWWVRELSEFFARSEAQGTLPPIRPVDAAWLVVYSTGATQIGSLPQEIVKPIVTWYGFARSFVAKLESYSRSYDGGSVDQAKCSDFIVGIKGNLPPMADLTFCACGLLCEYAKVPFEAPTIYVADDKTVSDTARTALASIRGILAKKAGEETATA